MKKLIIVCVILISACSSYNIEKRIRAENITDERGKNFVRNFSQNKHNVKYHALLASRIWELCTISSNLVANEVNRPNKAVGMERLSQLFDLAQVLISNSSSLWSFSISKQNIASMSEVLSSYKNCLEVQGLVNNTELLKAEAKIIAQRSKSSNVAKLYSIVIDALALAREPTGTLVNFNDSARRLESDYVRAKALAEL